MGASSFWICSVEAEYDWASFVINWAASAWSLEYCDFALFTSASDEPPPWLPTSALLAEWALRIACDALVWLRSDSICGLTSYKVSAAWLIHLPADSL
ncbi:hypothetical protein [Streptomyces sp. NPDC002851]